MTLEGELTTLNGGYNAKVLLESIDRNVIAEPLMPLDSYIDGAKSNPDFLKALADFEAAKQNVKVANAENLPSLSIGYAHEFEDGMHFNGANLGVSIPLFSARERRKRRKRLLLQRNMPQPLSQTARNQKLRLFMIKS